MARPAPLPVGRVDGADPRRPCRTRAPGRAGGAQSHRRLTRPPAQSPAHATITVGYLFESGWGPPGSRDRRRWRRSLRQRWPWASGAWVDDQAPVGDRFGEDRLFEEAVEQQAATSGAASVEAERELVEVRVEVVGSDGALVGAEAASV